MNEGLGRIKHVGVLVPAHEVDGVEVRGAIDEVDRVGEAVVARKERARDVGVDTLAELSVDLPVVGRAGWPLRWRVERQAHAPASRREAGVALLGVVPQAVALDAELREGLVNTAQAVMAEASVPTVSFTTVERVGPGVDRAPRSSKGKVSMMV